MSKQYVLVFAHGPSRGKMAAFKCDDAGYEFCIVQVESPAEATSSPMRSSAEAEVLALGIEWAKAAGLDPKKFPKDYAAAAELMGVDLKEV